MNFLVEIYGMELEELFNLGVAYLIANAGLIVAFIIYVIRLKLKEIKMSNIMNEAIEKINIQLNKETLEKIDVIQKKIELEMANLQKSVVGKIAETEEERNKLIEEKTTNFKETLDKFNESNKNIDEEINKILTEE